jgi:hypothetical protein
MHAAWSPYIKRYWKPKLGGLWKGGMLLGTIIMTTEKYPKQKGILILSVVDFQS